MYGPHFSCLYGSDEAWQELIDAKAGPNHFFIPQDDVSYQYELGCLSHESCAGLLGVRDYFLNVADADQDQPIRKTLEKAFQLFSEWERPITERLFNYLKSKDHVTVLGPPTTENRLPTISFFSSKLSSKAIVEHLIQHKIACRNGHNYAYRLVEALGIDLNDGVVRLSAVHYNNAEDIDKTIEVLDSIL